MAKILFAAGIDEVSGALTKINTKSKHSDDENMFLASHRKAETMSKHCQRAYFRKINNLPWNKNKKALSEDTLIRRNTFSAQAIAVAARRQDLSHMTADQELFVEINAQYKSKRGYSLTMKQFLWVAAEKYTTVEGRVVTVNMPANLALTIADFNSVGLKG